MSKTIYFDEAGFTGYNFLDPLQPIFTIASTDIDPEVAKALLNESFPSYKGNEYKFKNIWNSSNRKGILKLANLISQYTNHIHVYIIDKKFVTLVKMVDFLLEPSITNAGYDFYADGFCWKYANYIHFGLAYINKSDILDEVIKSYQTFSRKPSTEGLKILGKELLSWAEEAKEPQIKDILNQLANGALVLPLYSDLDTFRSTNELQLTTMFAIVSWWRKNYSEDFIIVHDASSNFGRQKETWEAVTNSNVEAQIHPLGDGSVVEFPLRVIETISINSKENCSIQLCDTIAGVCARIFDKEVTGADREILDNCIKEGFEVITYNSIEAQPIFPEFPPKELNGPDAVDLMTKVIKGSKA